MGYPSVKGSATKVKSYEEEELKQLGLVGTQSYVRKLKVSSVELWKPIKEFGNGQ